MQVAIEFDDDRYKKWNFSTLFLMGMSLATTANLHVKSEMLRVCKRLVSAVLWSKFDWVFFWGKLFLLKYEERS